MPRKDIFVENNSSDEEDPILDEDVCPPADIENTFSMKYTISSEEATSLKKVYILNLCSDKSFTRIAAGLSNGIVQLFDVTSSGILSRCTSTADSLTLENVGAICGLTYLDESPNNLLVGTTDGLIHLFDLRSCSKQHTFEDSTEGAQRKPITCFDLNANGRVICAGTDQVQRDVYLLFFDIRKKSLMGGYWESHQDDVTHVKFHPTNPDLLSTGSTDGLINLFDISKTSEDDALTSTINTESSVQKLNWHRNVYEKDLISCITHTNDLKMYEVEEEELILEYERSHITEAMKRKSVGDCNLINCHNFTDGTHFLLAGSNFNKGEVLRSLKIQNKSLIPCGNYAGNKQIIRESLYHSETDTLVTSGESGIVSLWKSGATENISQPILKMKTKSKKMHNPY